MKSYLMLSDGEVSELKRITFGSRVESKFNKNPKEGIPLDDDEVKVVYNHLLGFKNEVLEPEAYISLRVKFEQLILMTNT